MPKAGTPEPGDQESTRSRILRATIELMAERGIDRVRTRAVAERAGVNPALVHYHFGSISALVMEAAQVALLDELGPAIEALQSGETVEDSVESILTWIERFGELTPASTILAEAMVKATRDPGFREWSRNAARRFRGLILDRLVVAKERGEVDAELDLPATAVLLAGALDGLLFHRLVDGDLDVKQVAGSIDRMLGPKGPPVRTSGTRKE